MSRTMPAKTARMLTFAPPRLAPPSDDELPPMPFGTADDLALVPRGYAEPTTDASHTGFIHEQQPPEEWVRDIRSYSPKTDQLGWLYIYWESGDPWVPGQRWTLYEMLHENIYKGDEDGEELLAELNGKHPRSEGHMCSDKVPGQFQCLCPRKFEGWRGGPCQIITLAQYNIYHATGYVPLPFWIIQGTTGGHKFSFNENEQELLRMEGLPGDAPKMGSLPYAPYDGRVKKQIMQYNRIVQLDTTISGFKRTMGPEYEQHKRDVARKMRTNYLKYLGTQMADVSEEFARLARRGDLDDEQKTDVDYDRLEEAAEQEYVETGRVLHESEIATTKLSVSRHSSTSSTTPK